MDITYITFILVTYYEIPTDLNTEWGIKLPDFLTRSLNAAIAFQQSAMRDLPEQFACAAMCPTRRGEARLPTGAAG